MTPEIICIANANRGKNENGKYEAIKTKVTKVTKLTRLSFVSQCIYFW